LGHAFLAGMVRIPTMTQKCKCVLSSDNDDDDNEEDDNNNIDSMSSLKRSSWTLEGLLSRAPGPNLSASGTSGSMSGNKQQHKNQARELQFLSVDNRPVDLNHALSKVIANVWRSLFATNGGGGKRPVAILALTPLPNMVDVNVSPDKREVLLLPEADICGAVQQALIDLWSCHSQVNGIFPSHEVQRMSMSTSTSNISGRGSGRQQTNTNYGSKKVIASSSTNDNSKVVHNKTMKDVVHHKITPTCTGAVDVDVVSSPEIGIGAMKST
jgi:DNA mismatch repair ATPase MutL